MICPYCGSQLTDGSRVCNACLANLASEHAAPSAGGVSAETQMHEHVQQGFEAQVPEKPAPRQEASSKKKSIVPKVLGVAAGVVVVAVLAVFVALPAAGIDVPAAIDEVINPVPPAGADDEYLEAMRGHMSAVEAILEDGTSIASDLQDSIEAYNENGNDTKYLKALDNYTAYIEEDRQEIADLREDIASLNKPRTEQGKSVQVACDDLLAQADSALADLQEIVEFEKASTTEFNTIFDSVENVDADRDFMKYIEVLFQALSSAQSNMREIATPECLIEVWDIYTESMTSFKYSLAYLYSAAAGDGSILDYYNGIELYDWYVAVSNRYADEIAKIESKQLTQSQKLMGTSLRKRCIAISDACAENTVVADDSSSPRASIDYEIVTDIYPNMYPSTDSVINMFACTDKSEMDVLVTAEINGFTQVYEETHTLSTKQNYIMIKPEILTNLPDMTESRNTQITLTVVDVDTGKVLIKETQSVRIHSLYDFKLYDDDFGLTVLFDLLGWMRPESMEVAAINRGAVKYLEDEYDWGVLPGYQNGYGLFSLGEKGKDLTVLVQVAAIQKAISDAGVRYTMDHYTLDEESQHVLTADEVVREGTGICIESSVLMASCLTKAGLHSMIVLIPGHAQVAVESWDGSGKYYLIETTNIPYEGFTYDSKKQTFDFNGLVIEDVMTEQQWENYLADQENTAKRYGGCVFIIDCTLRQVLQITGLESA